jgi:hypothetical protein
VQPLGVDLATFHPAQRDPHLRAELGIADTSRLLIFAGRGSRKKNLPVLLDCMQRSATPTTCCWWARTCRPACHNVSVIDHFCPAAEVARLMASADLLVHAGDQETFGLVILEAMASAIPVVAVRAGAFTEIVNEQCGRLCTPNDRAMAMAVREAFERGPQARHAGPASCRATLFMGQGGRGPAQHYQAVLGHQPQVRAHAGLPRQRSLLLVLHDVAPETWPDYRRSSGRRRAGQRADDLAGGPGLPSAQSAAPGTRVLPRAGRTPGQRRRTGAARLRHADEGRHRAAPSTTSCAASTPTKVSSTA